MSTDIVLNLTQTLELLENTNEIANIGVFQFEVDTQNIYWNNVLKSIYEVSEDYEPSIDEVFRFVKDPKYKEQLQISHLKAIELGKPYELEYQIITAKGNERFIWVKGQPVFENGVCKYSQGAVLDITNRKITELELENKHQQLLVTERTSEVGYWRWETATNEETWSDNLYKIFEKEKGDKLTYDTYLEYVHPEDSKFVIKKFEEAFSNKILETFSHRIVLKNSSIKTILLAGQVITNETGAVVEMVGTCKDITEQISREREILEVNQILSFTEQLSNQGYWRWKPASNDVFWSENLFRLFGHKKESEVFFESYFELVHPEDKDFVKGKLEQTIKDQKFYDYSHRAIINGEIKTFQINGVVAKINKNAPLELLGTVIDVTESKIIEKELLIKNQTLSFAEEIASVGNWKWDSSSRKFEWSDNLYKIIGFEIGTPITFELYLTRIPNEQHDLVRRHLYLASKAKNIYKQNHTVICADGSLKILEISSKALRNEKDEIIQVLGTVIDITESKTKELELTEKNQMLSLLQELEMIGHWRINLLTGELSWADNLARIYDFDVGAPMNLEILFSQMHPDDIEKVQKLQAEYMKTKSFEKFTHRTIRKNGNIRTIEVVGKVITNEQGDAIEFIGSSRDITDQIKAQEDILESNKNLEKSTIELTARNKQLAEFNHITSHNLRAPVSNLNALLDLWTGAENESLKEELFGKFEIVIDHLTLTLNTLIESLKVSNKQDISIQELSFDKTLNKTKEILAAEILKTGAIFKSDFSNIESIPFNQIYLESIFLNLLSNSIKYKSPDRAPEVDIKSYVVNGKINLSFKDNGLGIDLKKHGHKLFGLNKVFHKHPEAKGVGLFLTKAQVEAMGGTIFAESEVNVGTTFYITFN